MVRPTRHSTTPSVAVAETANGYLVGLNDLFRTKIANNLYISVESLDRVIAQFSTETVDSM